MGLGMTRRKVLVCPMIILVRFSFSVPRDATVIFVVLCHMQIYLSPPVIEDPAAIIGVIIAISHT